MQFYHKCCSGFAERTRRYETLLKTCSIKMLPTFSHKWYYHTKKTWQDEDNRDLCYKAKGKMF